MTANSDNKPDLDIHVHLRQCKDSPETVTDESGAATDEPETATDEPETETDEPEMTKDNAETKNGGY